MMLFVSTPTNSKQHSTFNQYQLPYEVVLEGDDEIETEDGTLYSLTGFRLWRQYWRQFGGIFFGGAYFPQKWDLLPPFQPQFKLFQGHVFSY
jgi:hypothetical protein